MSSWAVLAELLVLVLLLLIAIIVVIAISRVRTDYEYKIFPYRLSSEFVTKWQNEWLFMSLNKKYLLSILSDYILWNFEREPKEEEWVEMDYTDWFMINLQIHYDTPLLDCVTPWNRWRFPKNHFDSNEPEMTYQETYDLWLKLVNWKVILWPKVYRLRKLYEEDKKNLNVT